MGANLGAVSVGSTVYLNVNGTRKEFIVVHQGLPSSVYDSSCDGTWLLMKDIYETRKWDSTDNDYANSDIHSYLNGTFLGLFDSDIQSVIKQVKLPYTHGTGSGGSLATGSSGLSAKVFLLSYTEVMATTHTYANAEGAALSHFNGAAAADRIAYLNGTATSWRLRSPYTIDTNSAWRVGTSGTASSGNVNNSYGVRPALILPSTLSVNDDNDVVVSPDNSAPSAPSSISGPSSVTVGETINVSCGDASDPDGDAIAYIFERSYNGGAWEVVQSSESQSFAETAPESWTTVQYRVCAQDSEGNTSAYIEGDLITVITSSEPEEPDEPDTPEVGDEFLEAIRNKAPQDVRLEFTDGSVIGKSDLAITSGGLTYTEVLNSTTDVEFGRAVMAELSAVLINADGRFTAFDFAREFTAKIGVKVGDAFEYVTLGIFKGERPEKVRGKLIDFTAHDRMALFDVNADTFVEGLTFPCTLGEIYTKLCSYCGIGYVSAEFVNSGKVFEANPLTDSDYTGRGILAWIAEAAGSYARMSRDGAVELVWFAAVDYTVTRTDRFEMTESEFETPPIDKLEVYNSYGDQLNSSGTGDIVYGISDNPFLYIENDTQLEGLQPYVDAIYERITSLSAYPPSSFRAEFNPAVKCGDIISVVDDYGVTIPFPVFVQTITWNGFGKTTYENTGGVIRQNAPFTQRELEQLKKKSVKTRDLWTRIDSYLSSPEGIASIESAVGGKFVTSDQLTGYVQETELEATMVAYINGTEGTGSLSQALSGKFVTSDALKGYAKTSEVSTAIDQKIDAFEATLTLSASSSTSSDAIEEDVGTLEIMGFIDPGYPFEETSDGYYTSTNAGAASSYSYAMINFDFDTATEITIRCISYGENNYDYGIVSEVDVELTYDATADSSGVFHSFKGEASSSAVDLTITIPSGSHFITFKYIKDSSQDSNGDYFKFRTLKITRTSSSQKSTITLKSGGIAISSADITFEGIVTFESLSTAGATTINGANIMTGTLSADAINVDDLYVKNVRFNDDGYPYSIISSELSSATSANINVGVMEDNGWAQFLNLFATQIRFLRPGYDADSDNNAVLVDIANTTISFADNNAWSVGSADYQLAYIWARRHGFYDGTYLRVTNGELRFYYNEGATYETILTYA